MKKILIPLLCVSLLTGCDFTFADEAKDPEPAQTEPQDNTPENQNGDGNQQQNNDNNQPSGDNNQSQEDEGQSNEQGTDDNNQGQDENQNGGTVYTKTVTFYNGGFTNSSLNQAQSQQTFVNWFNGDDDILESINYSGYCQLNYVGNEGDANRFSTLILGSSSQDGEIKLNFKYDVVSVKVTVQSYSKYIPYSSSWNNDINSVFYLDGEQHDLSLSAGYTGDTEKHDFTKSYNPAVKSVTISSDGGRVFVHSMELRCKKNSA